MLKTFTLTVLLALAPISLFAQSAEPTIIALANDFATAIVKRDVVAMERMLADDFIDVNPDGVVSPRKQFIDEYRNPPANANTFESMEFTVGDSEVRIHGDMALLTGPSEWKGKTADGHAFIGVLMTSMVAVKENGQWKIAGTHSSARSPK